uniref:Inositol phosphoceramide mannosyltransferase 3 n=1 Tax=Talaromyces marneffei PM1 TaxID=1077442 RepID=A0A093VSR9_TALMA
MFRPPPKSVVVGVAVAWVLIFLFFFRPTLELHFNNSEILTESYDFHETSEEAQCFKNIHASSKSPIPRVVHFLWGFGNHPEMTFMNYLAIRSALISLKPDTLKLHYEELSRDNIWFQRLQDNITLVHHNMTVEYPKQTKEHWQVSHMADALRLDILHREGGIYSDADVIALQSFNILLHNERDVILGHEGGDRHGLCNAIILARPDAAFLGQWIDRYNDFVPSEWNYHSVLLPKEMSLEQPSEICTLAPNVFFWPTWTHRHIRYMHADLSREEVVEVENLLDTYGGAFYSNQLAYHAWSQVAREEYLDRLTPELVKEKDTRFNLMVRRFL